MATLTYDANEAQEGELSAEEQDSLKVGEALAEQEDKKLAGKFEDAEALEKAYIELQSKLGEPKEERADPSFAVLPLANGPEFNLITPLRSKGVCSA